MAISKPFLLTPDDMRAEIKTIRNAISGMKKAIDNTPSLDEEIREKYLEFVSEWDRYESSLSGIKDTSGWSVWDYMGYMVRFGASPALATADALPDGLKLLVTGSWDKLQEFRDTASGWRETLIKAGVSFKNPEMKANPIEDKPFRVPWWVWVGGGALLIWKISPLRTAERVKSLSKPTKTVTINR